MRFLRQTNGENGESGGWQFRLPSTFAALRHRNFQLFYFGQLVSLIGTWMQGTAQPWLVYTVLDQPKFMLGAISAIGMAPVLFLSLLGGVVADRLDKRRIVIIAQTVYMFLALGLGVLIHLHLIQVWHVALFAALGGIVASFEMPARQAMVVELVGKRDLMNAITLNSSSFNAARVVGPAIAGMLIASLGMVGCYYANSASYLAVIVGVLLIRLPPREQPAQTASISDHLREGLSYVRGLPALRTLLTALAVSGIFAMSFPVLMPVFARDILFAGQPDQAARGFGFLLAASALGAVIGGLVMASSSERRDKATWAIGGLLLLSSMQIAFSFSTWFWLSFLFAFFTGWGMISFAASSNTLLQTLTPDEYRGRVMGIYALVWMGSSPIGALQAGTLAEHLGAPEAVRIGASICALTALLMLPKRKLIREAERRMQQAS